MKGDEDIVQRGKPRTDGKRIAEVKERKRIADEYQTDGKRRAEEKILCFILLTSLNYRNYPFAIYRMFRNRYLIVALSRQ